MCSSVFHPDPEHNPFLVWTTCFPASSQDYRYCICFCWTIYPHASERVREQRMGRKPAPQPLALSDRSALGASQNVAAETHSSTIPSTSSPISSKSPTSPRSPFRFIQEKSPSLISKSYNPAPGKITSRSQTTSPSPLSSSVAPPQVQEQQQIPPAEISASKVTHLEGKTADEEEEQEEEEEEKEEYYQPTSIDEAIHKSLSSTAASPVPLIVQDSSAPFLTAQSTPVAPVGQAARHTPSDARQRRLQDSEEALGAAATVSAPSTPAGKHSKSGGGGGGKFFSHFSRPSHQHNSSTPPKHPPSPQGGESTSKDSDRRTIPGSAHGKSSKKSGTAETFIIGRLSTPWETTPESCTHLAAEMVSSQGEALHSTLTSNHAENAIAARTAIAEGPCPDSMITRANDEDAGATKKRLRTCQVLPSRRPRPVRQKLAPTKKLSRLLHDRGARPPGTAGCDVTTPPSSPTKYVVSNMLTLSLSIDQCFQKSLSLRQQNPSKSDLSIASNAEIDAPASSAASTPAKRSKPKPFALLNRSRSNRDKDASAPQDNDLLAPPTARLADPERTQRALRTAPVAHERTFRDMMNSAVRNRSEDRNGQSHSRETSTHREEKHSRTQPSSFKENSGFLSNLRNSSRTAADMFSKGLFGKSARSAGTNEKEPVVDDEHYVLKVINLPLIEQTRLTRISKRLEDSRDKTEFWMPAFPWRAIDYLNFKGCEVEGLYRVPGSGPQVKRWQRKFDEGKVSILSRPWFLPNRDARI